MNKADWIPLLKGMLDLVVSLLPLITFYIRKKVKERLDRGTGVPIPIAALSTAPIPDDVESQENNAARNSTATTFNVGKNDALTDDTYDTVESISKNFYLSELTHSNTAGRRRLPNVPGADEIEALRALCENVLEPLKDRYPSMRISSAYRSPVVNRHVGGKHNSQHMEGQAADLHFPGQNLREIWEWIRDESGIDYDQLILEPRWIHISFKAQEDNRMWAFKILGGKKRARSARGNKRRR